MFIIIKTSSVSIDVDVYFILWSSNVILHSYINEVLLTILTNHTQMVYTSHYTCSKSNKTLSKNSSLSWHQRIEATVIPIHHYTLISANSRAK